ncbi:hypothetical protein SNE40_023038 [Patella caerulea]|uniref:Uncharacterized protein n=1 Tax=Patella caerulea TaxID=87958 RepID=A0AAN8G9C6_PATCE
MELSLLFGYIMLLLAVTRCIHGNNDAEIDLQSELDHIKTLENESKMDLLGEIPQSDDSYSDLQKRSKLDRMPAIFGKRANKLNRMPAYFGKRTRLNRMPAVFGKRSRLNRMPAVFGKRSTLDRMPSVFGKRSRLNRMPAVFGKRSRLNRMPAVFGKRDNLVDLMPELFEKTDMDGLSMESNMLGQNKAADDLLSIIQSNKMTVEELSALMAQNMYMLVPLVRTFIDANGDGLISVEELMSIKTRNP